MTDPQVKRRTLIKGAVWFTPVVALAVATPLAAASGEPTEEAPRIPIKCDEVSKHVYFVTYNDGTNATLGQGEVNRDKTLQALCLAKGPLS